MNCYLVLLKHTMDDLPVRVFPHTKRGRAAALCFAGALKPMPEKNIRRVFNTDCSTPCQAAVVEFVEGVPVEIIGSINYDD